MTNHYTTSPNPARAADRIIDAWRPWLDRALTDDTFETVTLLIRGTCEASALDERYPVSTLAAALGTTKSSLVSRFFYFGLPSFKGIQVRIHLLCIIDRRESLARQQYNHRYTLEGAAGAAAVATSQALGRFLRRYVPELTSPSHWIRTADFADVATTGARLLFESPNWSGFHATKPNFYTTRPLAHAPRCAECGRPTYGRERTP